MNALPKLPVPPVSRMRELALNGIEKGEQSFYPSTADALMPSAMERDYHTLLVPVAAGELIDKITILQLKAERLQRPEALANVGRELQALEAVLNEASPALGVHAVLSLTDALQAINTQLWDVEDALRLLEAEKRFDQEFIRLARSVYQLNDQRAALKRKINEACGSSLVDREKLRRTKASKKRNEQIN